jgi:hypothetical protein
MNQAGVWSFRTQTGIARVVNGSLRTRHTLYGLTIGSYRRLDWKSALKHIGLGFGSVSLFGPVTDLIQAVVIDGSLGAVSILGVVSLLAVLGTVVTLSLPVLNRSAEPVDMHDITGVTVDTEDCELVVNYDDGESSETTTVAVYDEAELEEAVDILRLKGAPIVE